MLLQDPIVSLSAHKLLKILRAGLHLEQGVFFLHCVFGAVLLVSSQHTLQLLALLFVTHAKNVCGLNWRRLHALGALDSTTRDKAEVMRDFYEANGRGVRQG